MILPKKRLFLETKKQKVYWLQLRNWRNIVETCNISDHCNIPGGPFILSLKAHRQSNKMAKVGFVGQGFDDTDNLFMAHDTCTLRSASTQLILFPPAICRFCIFSLDVTQTYLQSKNKLTCETHIRIKTTILKRFGLEEDGLLELNNALYKLCDAGDY